MNSPDMPPNPCVRIFHGEPRYMCGGSSVNLLQVIISLGAAAILFFTYKLFLLWRTQRRATAPQALLEETPTVVFQG